MMNTPKTSKIKEKSFSQETWCTGLALSQVSTSEACSGEMMTIDHADADRGLLSKYHNVIFHYDRWIMSIRDSWQKQQSTSNFTILFNPENTKQL